MKCSKFLFNCSDQVNFDLIIETIPLDKGWDTPMSYEKWMDRMEAVVLPYLKNGTDCLASVNQWNQHIPFESITAYNVDIPADTEKMFKKVLKLEKIIDAEYSRILPGKCIPSHPDGWQPEWPVSARKFSIFVSKPEFGHVFILGKDHYCATPQGDVIEWNNPHEWHIGLNFGVKPKWLLNIIGY
jgi:hypothetical protein